MKRFPLGLLLRSKWFMFLTFALALLLWLGARQLLGIGAGEYSALAALVWMFLVGLTIALIVDHLSNFHAIVNVMGDQAIDRADYEEQQRRAQERRQGRGKDQDNGRWL